MDPRSFPPSGAQTPSIVIDELPYEESQPLNTLLKSLQHAMLAATAIDTGGSFWRIIYFVTGLCANCSQSGEVHRILGFEKEILPSLSTSIPGLTLRRLLRKYNSTPVQFVERLY